jgi:hypothetical protein
MAEEESLPADVVRLVIASRRAVEAGDWASGDRRGRIATLDQAVEAFASRVPWEDDPSDSGSGPQGENPERSGGVECEAPQSGAPKSAHRPNSKVVSDRPEGEAPIMLQIAAATEEQAMWERRWLALQQMYARERCFVDRDGHWGLRCFLDYVGQICGFASLPIDKRGGPDNA